MPSRGPVDWSVEDVQVGAARLNLDGSWIDTLHSWVLPS